MAALRSFDVVFFIMAKGRPSKFRSLLSLQNDLLNSAVAWNSIIHEALGSVDVGLL